MAGAHVIVYAHDWPHEVGALTELAAEDSAKLENENAVIDQAEGVAPEQGEIAAILFNLPILRLKYR